MCQTVDKPRSRKRYKLKATIFDKRGRVLSTGENSYWKTHPFQKTMGTKSGKPESIFLHAEISALIKLKDWSKAYRIFIERYDDRGNPKMAKPCEACARALSMTNIKVIDYTK